MPGAIWDKKKLVASCKYRGMIKTILQGLSYISWLFLFCAVIDQCHFLLLNQRVLVPVLIGNFRSDIQGGHSINVVYDLRRVWECNPQKLKDFSILALKWLKISTKHLKNAKINNADLYYNFSPRFKNFFFNRGPVPPCTVAYG